MASGVMENDDMGRQLVVVALTLTQGWGRISLRANPVL